eukprot:SAG25_NODE_2823_length_1369_cov_1.744094_1_plen_290_part_01
MYKPQPAWLATIMCKNPSGCATDGPRKQQLLAGELDDPAIRRQIVCVQAGQFLRACQYTLTVTAQTTLGLQLTHGNMALLTALISRAMGASALVELMISPLVGKLSDSLGPKPVLMAGGLAKLVPYLLMAFRPSIASIVLCNVLTDASYHMYRLAEGALLADMLPGLEPLAIASARCASMMGLAAVCGNLVGGALSTVSLRIPYVLGAACSVGNAAVIAWGVRARPRRRLPPSPPPHARSRHRDVTAEAKAFFRLPALLCRGHRLRMLTLACLLSDVVDLTFPVRPIFAQ